MGEEIKTSGTMMNLKQYLAGSVHTQVILHGAMDTPGLDLRLGYPNTWEEKITYAVRNQPHLAAKQIYPSSLEESYWSCVGLVVSDGTITSCSGLSETLPNGDRIPIKVKPEELRVPLEEKLESSKFDELAIRKPHFSALYLHDYWVNYKVIPRLCVESVERLAHSLDLPLIVFKQTAELFELAV